MSEVGVSQAKKEIADLMNRVTYGRERIRITRKGHSGAALVPLEDLELLEALEEVMDCRDALDALREGREKGFSSLESLLEVMGL
jgi:prevent-host-death family protein